MTRREMTRGLRSQSGFFGVAVWHPKHEANIGTLWRSAMTYEATMLATVGPLRYQHQASDTTKAPRHIPLQHFADIDDLIDHLPHSCPLVGVELDDRAVPLTSFHHPRQALYLLGAEDHGLPPSVLDRCHHVVQIPTPMRWSLNLAVAGSLLMHDRVTKKSVAIGGAA